MIDRVGTLIKKYPNTTIIIVVVICFAALVLHRPYSMLKRDFSDYERNTERALREHFGRYTSRYSDLSIRVTIDEEYDKELGRDVYRVWTSVTKCSDAKFDNKDVKSQYQSLMSGYNQVVTVAEECKTECPYYTGLVRNDTKITRWYIFGRKPIIENYHYAVETDEGRYSVRSDDMFEGYFKNGEKVELRTCEVNGCDLPVKSLYATCCSKHGCVRCGYRAISGSSYCKYHKCQKCSNPVDGDNELCKEHMKEIYRKNAEEERKKRRYEQRYYSSSDPYNAKSYSDYEDFYYDNMEDFDGLDDAESYWDEHH